MLSRDTVRFHWLYQVLVERKKMVYIRFIEHRQSLEKDGKIQMKMNNLHRIKHEIIDDIIIAMENVKQLQDQSFVLFW